MPTSLALQSDAAPRRLKPNRWDFVALPLVLGVIVLLALAARQIDVPFTLASQPEISLEPGHLPEYALRTVLRMMLALGASLLFTFCYATLAAKSRRAEMILVPMLDILQSVPILGYISFTVTLFLALFPGRLLGAELAAIFAIFTSQAWNMTFSLYQSLRTVPRDLTEAAAVFQLTSWQRFWRLEVPFALPGLVWNTMISMSGGWFFVVASEAISVADKKISLPGIGSYIALAIDRSDLTAVGWAVLAMFVVILIYDQLLFRPLVVWSDRFKVQTSPSQFVPESWVYELFRRARLMHAVATPVAVAVERFRSLRIGARARAVQLRRDVAVERVLDYGWGAAVAGATAYACFLIGRFVLAEVSLHEIGTVLLYGLYTAIRVFVLIMLAALFWVPIGVWVGLRPQFAERVQPIAQFLAAFPANLLFPIAVVAIARFALDPDIWLSPLMILGTQWYILFNVIAGASAFPSDLREAASSFGVRGLLWWRRVILPAIVPYFLTGALAASGGSWNASIVAEAVSWGDQSFVATGLGSYIAANTDKGDFPRIMLGIAVMCIYVTVVNRLVWEPARRWSERRLRG